MDSVGLITKYFRELDEGQLEKFSRLREIYTFWNSQINVISRKDFDSFYERHVLHSLAVAKTITFPDGASVLDVGTGGGFPGIPLAIMFPKCDFHLVDSIGKKIKVVEEVAKSLNLKNVRASQERAENVCEKFDFIVSRAVTSMPTFLTWTKNKFKVGGESVFQKGAKKGILYLKGGDLTEEMKSIRQKIKYYNISDFFEEDFFETKKVVYLEIA